MLSNGNFYTDRTTVSRCIEAISMARMLGDAVLPEQIQSSRRRLRNRLSDLRQPVRQFREENVPGPNVVGNLESRFSDLRDRFVSRTTVLERIRSQRNGDGMTGDGQGQQQDGGTGSGSGSGSGSSRRTVN